jgi:acyl-CoA thioesterase-2
VLLAGCRQSVSRVTINLADAVAAPFIPLAHDAATGLDTLDVSVGLSVGPPEQQFMFGGVGIGAALASMERLSGRPAIWATAQYLSYARPGSRVEITPMIMTEGRAITQARATITCDGREVLTATAAMGERDGWHDHWPVMPDVPRPEACAEARHWRALEGTLNSHFEYRPALGRYPGATPITQRSETGRLAMWVRPREGQAIDRMMLAVIADFVPSGISNAMGRGGGGNSLDNTVRYCRIVPTDWVLCDIQIEAVASGIVHGAIRLFAEDGTLMATASQTLILRLR